MSISPAMLNMTCTIQTPDEGAIDAHGHVKDGTWTDTYTGVKCYWFGYQRGREVFGVSAGGGSGSGGREKVIAEYEMDLLPSQPITEEMRVTAVAGSDGTAVLEGATFEVTNVREMHGNDGRLDHKNVYLRLVR